MLNVFLIDILKIQKLYNNTSTFNKDKTPLFINSCVKSLLAKEIIIFPTDTIYGLLGIYDKDVINQIHQVKDRALSKSCLLLVHEDFNLEPWIDWGKYDEKNLAKTQKLLTNLWPPKTTYVFYKNKTLDYPKGETIAFRKILHTECPTLSILLKIINQPVLAPSLNRSTKKPMYNLQTIKLEFEQEVSTFVYDTSFKPHFYKSSKVIDTTTYPYINLR